MKSFKMIYVPIGLMLLFGALMIGLPDYINAGFDPSVLWSPNFIVNLMTTNGGILALILAILLLKVDTFKETDLEYLAVTKEIITFKTSGEYSKPIFNTFAAEINKESKKEAYNIQIQEKFSKLKPTAKDLEIYNGKDEKAKSRNRYCKQINYLERISNKEYVDKNIDKMSLTYNTVTDALIFNGIATTSKSNNYIVTHQALKVFKDFIPKFLLGFAMTTVISMVAVDLKEGITASVLLNTFTKVFTISLQINFAINYSQKFNQEVTLWNANFRWGVITSFRLWIVDKVNKHTEEPKKGVELDG